MKRPCFAPAVALSLALTSPSFAAPPETDTPVTGRSAEALLEEARRHLDHKRFEAAFPLLREAYGKDPTSYRIVGNLGIVEHELGRWAAAANHLAAARDRLPADGPPAHREAIEMRLQDASARAGRLTVVLSPDVACIRIDDAPPRCGEQVSLYVPAGPVPFSIEAPEHVTQRREVELEAGMETAVTVTLLPTAPPPGPPAPSAAEGLPAWPSYLVTSVGLAAVVGGVIMFVAGDAAAREADRELVSLREDTGLPAPCASPSAGLAAPRCVAIADDLGRHDQLHDGATGMLLGGLGAMVLGGVLFGLSVASDEGDDDVALTVSPSLSPRATGLTLHRRF